MNWLNLKTTVLHSPEYIGCKPVARATWLNVSLWCSAQENAGRIVGSKLWGSRQWQQLCGVTRKEIDSCAPLLTWDEDDLLVWGYPSAKEAEVQAKREAGREGGVKSGLARLKQNGSTASSCASTGGEAQLERNGKEGEGKGSGKEEEDTASAFGGPSKLQWLARVEPLGHREWWEKKWFSAEKTGWMSGRTKIVAWEPHQDGQMQWFRSYAKEQDAKNAPPDESAFEADLQAQRAIREAAEQSAQAELQTALAGSRE